MRTKVVAALMISALASPAIAQSLPPLNLWRDKPAPSEEEVKREKAIDRAYKDTINQIPTKKTQDPWGNVRNAETKPTKPGPKN
jgi:hypothetical protein